MKTIIEIYQNIIEKESYQGIKEKRPIKVEIEKMSKGRLRIKVPPMTMRYETWQSLDHKHLHPFKNDDYSTDRIGVDYTSYDYEDGSAEFVARSKEDLKKWLNYPEYKGIVKI